MPGRAGPTVPSGSHILFRMENPPRVFPDLPHRLGWRVTWTCARLAVSQDGPGCSAAKLSYTGAEAIQELFPSVRFLRLFPRTIRVCDLPGLAAVLGCE